MHLCSTLLFRILLVKILLLGVLLCLPRSLDAEEGGSRLYVPGAYSSLLNITPNKPGVAVGDAFYFYKGDLLGNSTLAFGGLLASSINANVYFEGISFAYTFSPTILGAHYTVAATIPYLWVNVEARVSITPRRFAIGTLTKTIRDSANGVTDMAFIPIALNWTFGDLQINPQLVVYAPTGDYTKGQLANVGQNHWIVDNVLGLSYLSHKTGTEFTIFGGFAFATEDPATPLRQWRYVSRGSDVSAISSAE